MANYILKHTGEEIDALLDKAGSALQEIPKEAFVEIVNNVTEGGENKALSAEMGKFLNDKIAELVITGGGSSVMSLSGKLNLAEKTAVQNAQKALANTNEIAYYLITDNEGKIPSNVSCYRVPEDVATALGCSSPHTITQSALSLLNISLNGFGVNVGDLIALTRVKVKVSDLASSIGKDLSILGNTEIEIYQYKILSTNDAKPYGYNDIAEGVAGLMSPWDKVQVNGIKDIAKTAGEALPKNDLLPSRWETNMNNALQTGVYPWCTLGRPSGSTGAYTCIVKRTSTSDGAYNTIEQTAYGREAELGQVYKRIIFEKTDGTEKQFGEWVKVSTDADYMFEARIETRKGYDIGRLLFTTSLDNFTNKVIFGLVKVKDVGNNDIDIEEGIGIITNYNARYNIVYIGASTYYSGYLTDLSNNGMGITLYKQTASIANGSITTDKIAKGAITADKIADGVLNGSVVPVSHAGILPSTETVQIMDISSPIGVSFIATNEDASEGYYVPSYFSDGFILVFDIDCAYDIVLDIDDEGNPIGSIADKVPTKSQVYATKNEVASAISEAITKTLNTEV